MGVWMAFLRGINLGKRQVKMAELKACREAAGFSDIKTVVASGSSLPLSADSGTAAIKGEKLEAAITAQFGFDVGVVLRSKMK